LPFKKTLQQETLGNSKRELVENLAKTNKELEDYAQSFHDLKSPLRSIHSLTFMEKRRQGIWRPNLKYFSMIENKVEKMDHLIKGY
jgi:light-regulated signal transduction histidine kinase (bacteriophytochrome)